MEILPYSRADEKLWDDFCSVAVNATFLYTRRFLNYHGDRFKDLSVMIVDAGKLVAIFPAAESRNDQTLVISHPGITYGGIVHAGWVTGMRMIAALKALDAYYSTLGYQKLQYKVIPSIFTVVPAQDDLYALFVLGAQQVRCDLSCAIDLASQQPLRERRQRGLKKALKTVVLSSDISLLGNLWGVIKNNLAREHASEPVHTLDEITLLASNFPEEISICCALMDDHVEAGIVIFASARVWHAQYIAASENGYRVSALDAVFDFAIKEAQRAGARYFDFGTSNEDQGKILNDGLYRYKSEYGGGGVAHVFYELNFSNDQ